MRSSKDAIIYLIFNTVNGKCYVGKTVKSLRKRWWEHVRSAKKGFSRAHIHNAIRFYGKECFTVQQLERCKADEVEEKEKIWILGLTSHTSLGGYNLTWGGEGGGGHAGHKHSLESRALMSAKLKGRKPSAENLRKLAIANSKRKPTPEHIAKLVNAARNRVWTPEMRAATSARFKGKFSGEKNPMFGVRLTGTANPFFGKKHSKETKARWSSIRKGVKQSPECQAKKRIAMKRIWSARSAEEVKRITRPMVSKLWGKKVALRG